MEATQGSETRLHKTRCEKWGTTEYSWARARCISSRALKVSLRCQLHQELCSLWDTRSKKVLHSFIQNLLIRILFQVWWYHNGVLHGLPDSFLSFVLWILLHVQHRSRTDPSNTHNRTRTNLCLKGPLGFRGDTRTACHGSQAPAGSSPSSLCKRFLQHTRPAPELGMLFLHTHSHPWAALLPSTAVLPSWFSMDSLAPASKTWELPTPAPAPP